MRGRDSLTRDNYQRVVKRAIRRIPEDLRGLVGYRPALDRIVVTVAIPDSDKEFRLEEISVLYFSDLHELRKHHQERMPGFGASGRSQLLGIHPEEVMRQQVFFIKRPMLLGGWVISLFGETQYRANMREAVSTAILDLLTAGGIIRQDNRCRYFRCDGSRIYV
ncbi:MAG: hypothetical protein ACK506_18940 [Pirellula sp.]